MTQQHEQTHALYHTLRNRLRPACRESGGFLVFSCLTISWTRIAKDWGRMSKVQTFGFASELAESSRLSQGLLMPNLQSCHPERPNLFGGSGSRWHEAANVWDGWEFPRIRIPFPLPSTSVQTDTAAQTPDPEGCVLIESCPSAFRIILTAGVADHFEVSRDFREKHHRLTTTHGCV
ncbi:hypothetical protein BO99DRAFT_414923 [Aspergillus violaceofuscus CBS 115571]|uniref:Uncharacterized protein n=1 Tax=Aspergillus violaceofuscus (strain CBS 115571) TaxID=1450538 RepID=A0A2V5IAM3_ASPV1|nr:hypothetical protein BO99DRAFT_414923 [Aspergillus violaceofuscus CBS 115571]